MSLSSILAVLPCLWLQDQTSPLLGIGPLRLTAIARSLADFSAPTPDRHREISHNLVYHLAGIAYLKLTVPRLGDGLAKHFPPRAQNGNMAESLREERRTQSTVSVRDSPAPQGISRRESLDLAIRIANTKLTKDKPLEYLNLIDREIHVLDKRHANCMIGH